MKIYTRIVMDLTRDDLPVIESESYEYEGPLSLCGWGDADNDPGSRSGGSMSGPGPSSLGSDGPSDGPSGGGRGGGWGDSPHGNPHGTLGPSPDNYGGRSQGLSAQNAHAGMSGLGLGLGNREERGLLQSLTRRDNRAIRAAQAQARRHDPNPSRMDTARNILSAAWTGARALFSMASVASPLGVLGATRTARGIYNQQVDDTAYRSALGLPALSAPEMTETPDRGGDTTTMAMNQAHAPRTREDILAETRQRFSRFDPEDVLDVMPEMGDEIVREAVQKALRMGIPEIMQKRKGGATR